MARSRRTVGGRGRVVNRNSRLGRGNILGRFEGGSASFFTFASFPRAVGRTRLTLHGHRNGGWLNPRNW